MRTFLFFLGMFVASSIVIAQSERSLIREGNSAYKQGKFADAEVSYRKALNKNQGMESGTFNLGDALYKQGRFDEAAEQYRIAATRQQETGSRAQALHNLGNALVKGQKIADGITAYKEALKVNPNDVDTKYNLEYAKALLQKQHQQQNQKKDDKKDQQKQDQSKQDQQKQDQQKQDQQKQDQQKQDQQKDQDKQQGEQPKKMQISKEDAERILQALRNEERDVQKKLKKKAPARVRVEKDW